MGIREQLKNESGEIEPLMRYELGDRIRMLESRNETRDKALISFLYLTGARIEEVVKYIIERYRSEDRKRKKVGEPIKKKQVEILENEGKVYVNRVRCLKRDSKVRRRIVFLITEREEWFFNLFKKWYDKKEFDDPLFNITRQRANQICKKARVHPHHLRHMRMTELVTDYSFTESELMKFAGWATNSTAKEYTHLNVEDIEAKMKRAVDRE